MADRVLPSRDSFKRSGVTLMDAKPILAAYVRDELKTEVEWREVTIDYEAAYQWASENFVPQKFIDQCLDAALGVEV